MSGHSTPILLSDRGKLCYQPSMLYLGGKGRLGPSIASAILNHAKGRNDYYEPFIGGGNSFKHLAPHFKNINVGDVSEDLMLMWSAAANGWVPPSVVSEDEYKALRKAEPSALRGFVAFGCSFGGKEWGGYARSKQNGDDYYARHAYNEVVKIGQMLRGATIRRCSYKDWSPAHGAVVYADPPYRGTTRYRSVFDHDQFWKTMTEWAIAGANVFVSEYSVPDDWKTLFQKEQPRKVSGGTGAQTVERLFVHSSQVAQLAR